MLITNILLTSDGHRLMSAHIRLFLVIPIKIAAPETRRMPLSNLELPLCQPTQALKAAHRYSTPC
jgi:hypothetical protein